MRFGKSRIRYGTCFSSSKLVLFIAWRVQPRNYLLFACHVTNATAQSLQGARFVNFWYNGGREKKYGMVAPANAADVTPSNAQDVRQEAKKVPQK